MAKVTNDFNINKIYVKKYEIPFKGNITIDHVAKMIVVHDGSKNKTIPFSEGIVCGYRESKNEGAKSDIKTLAKEALKNGVPTCLKAAAVVTI